MASRRITPHPSRIEAPAEPRPVAQLRMLHSLAAQLNRLRDVRQIGEAITAELRNLVDYHNCRVFLLDADGETLIPIAFRGDLLEYQGESFDALVTKVGRGLTGHVAQTGQSYYSPNANNDPYAITIPGTPEVDESLLAVPLTYGDAVTGVVMLSKLGIDQFDHDDLRVLEVLASHAAVAIENARSLERERETAAGALVSEARKTAILEAALDPIIVMNHLGRVTEFNPAAERTFGYPRTEAVGRALADLIVPPRLRAAHRAGLARYLATGERRVIGKRVETRGQRADGTEFPVELAISRVELPGPPLFTAHIRDITVRKQAEVEVARALEAEREAARRLRDLDEMKNTFLKAVSHDLRTPLSSILGIAVTLERPDTELTPEERADLTRRLVPNARKLYRILSNLLDLERLLSGTVEPRIVSTQMDELVRRVVLEADFLAGRDVHLDLEPFLAEVDPTAIERIVENLLGNAAKHTDGGTPVWVRVSSQPDGVLLVVEDAGPGVPEAARTDIFEPFRQGPGDHPSPGTGIGLSLVSRFAELHGGRAWVEDRPGGGASFRVTIPTPAGVLKP